MSALCWWCMVSVGFVLVVYGECRLCVGGVWRVSALCWWCMVSVGFVLVVYGERQLCLDCWYNGSVW